MAATADYRPLIRALKSCVAETTWGDSGGPGSIAPFHAADVRALVVSQTQAVHEEIETLLRNLRAARHGEPPPGLRTQPIARATAAEQDGSRGVLEKAAQRRTESEARLRKALEGPLTVEFKETPLDDVIEHFRGKTKLPFVVHKQALNDVGIGTDEPVTCKAKDRPLRFILNDILRSLKLTWILADEAILITTPEDADSRVETRVYDIGDLPAFRDAQGRPVPDYDGLTDTIQSTVAPTAWGDVGGLGTIAPFNQGGVQALIVMQSQLVHAEIADLLATARKVRTMPLSKEQIAKLPPAPAPVRDLLRGARLAQDDLPLPDDPLMPEADPLPSKTRWKELAQDTNQAGLDLFAALRKGDKGNVFFSPFSITSAMAMAYGGARGQTAVEMARGQGFRLPPEELHPAMRTLTDSYRWANREATTTVRVANRLWGRGDYRYRPEFLALTRQTYGAEMAFVDFTDPEATARTINSWIEEQTAKRIQGLAAPQGIDKDMRLVLTNAVYFRAKWQSQFEPADTKQLPFYVGRETKHTPTMFMAGQHRYGDFGNARVLEKSYLGGQLAMVVLLPADDVTALDELEAMLTDRLLDAWLEKLQDREVWLYLPKFRMERQFKLVESLRAMGIRRAFDREQANFSGMSEQRDIYLADVLHKVFIDVAEQGTEAAAATVFFGGGMGGFEPPKPVIFRADHPFLFLIRDTRTGSILFLGRLNDPTAR